MDSIRSRLARRTAQLRLRRRQPRFGDATRLLVRNVVSDVGARLETAVRSVILSVRSVRTGLLTVRTTRHSKSESGLELVRFVVLFRAQTRRERPLRLLGDSQSPPSAPPRAQRLGVLDERRDVLLVLKRHIRQVRVGVRGRGGDRRRARTRREPRRVARRGRLSRRDAAGCSTCCSRRARPARSARRSAVLYTDTGTRRPRIRLSVAKDPCQPPPSGRRRLAEKSPSACRARDGLRAERVDEPVVARRLLSTPASRADRARPARARPGARPRLAFARVLARRLARRQRRGRPSSCRRAEASRAVSCVTAKLARCAARHPSSLCPGGCRRRTRPRSVRSSAS